MAGVAKNMKKIFNGGMKASGLVKIILVFSVFMVIPPPLYLV